MFTTEEITQLGITEDVAAKVVTLASEKLKSKESEWSKSIANVHNIYEKTAGEVFGIPKNENEKGSDYLKRAAGLKLSESEKTLAEKLTEIENQYKGGANAEFVEKLSNAQKTIKDFQLKESELQKKLSETTAQYEKRISEIKENTLLNSNIPAVDFSTITEDKTQLNLLKAGFNFQKEAILQQIRSEYSIDTETGIATNNTTQIQIKVAELVAEKMKDFLPQTQATTKGGGAGAQGGGVGTPDSVMFGFVPIKGMNGSEAYEKFAAHFKTTPFDKAINRAEMFEKNWKLLLEKIK